VEEVSEEVVRKQYEMNYWGPLKIIRAILPSMREGERDYCECGQYCGNDNVADGGILLGE
jgi:NAD(P)-dependent dehydrogenase (short-subunit alcohol dehydrogenase family)